MRNFRRSGAQIEGRRISNSNQREYCKAHGLPLERVGNRRAKFKHEDAGPTGQQLCFRSGGSGHKNTRHFLYHPERASLPAIGQQQRLLPLSPLSVFSMPVYKPHSPVLEHCTAVNIVQLLLNIAYFPALNIMGEVVRRNMCVVFSRKIHKFV